MRRYRDYNTYLREIFGERVQKIALDAALGCPNRDGTLSSEGCIYCDRKGSGTGAMLDYGKSIERQVEEGIQRAGERFGARKFIAYFQSFTNTYGAVPRLKKIYDSALRHPGMVGLAVGTRPDCVNNEILDLLRAYTKAYLVWVEYGLQSAHDATLQRIRRGHNVATFERSVLRANDAGLNVCAHVILGLPGETPPMMAETAGYLAGLPVKGVKIHLLYVVKGTALATMYKQGDLRCLAQEEYVDLVVEFLERLPPSTVIHRLTGDPFAVDLVAPAWAMKKSETLNLIKRKLEERDTWQGKKHQSFIAER